MTQYLLSVHMPTDVSPRTMTEEEERAGYSRVAALENEMHSAGALLASGRLEEASAAAVVNAPNGKPMTTDGPFLEAKEALGGFYIIEATDRDAALAWAEKTSAAIGMPIEVRGVYGFRTDPA
jgi:hypothetical protein